MFNSLFFLALFFWVKIYFSLFSLYKHSLWNLNFNSWSAWKSNQNGILVCEIWWHGIYVKLLLAGEQEVDFSPWLVGPIFVIYAVSITPPFSKSPPPFLFHFFCIFLYYFSSFYLFIFVIFFLLSISRNMQHYLMHFFFFFIFLYLFYLIYFSIISCIFSFFIYLLYLVYF